MKDQRQNEIIKLLSVEKSVKTESLASHFNVSMETIRRDINTLERAGLIRKVYGGICLPSDTVHLTALDNWNERLNQYHGEKVRIATKALELIPDYCVIALDIGTTAYELARLLGQKRGLSVITNSLLIAGELARNTSHKVYCIGGMVSPDEIVTCGIYARNFLNNFASINLFVGSADGITPKGITEFSEAVVDIKCQLIACADKNIALVDHSKFGKEALFVSCPMQKVDTLVTDGKAPQKELDIIRSLGVDVIVA